MFNIHQTCRQTKGLKVITAPFPSPSFIWTFKSYFIITLVSLSLMYRPWETCLLASDSFVRYLCAIWCLGCTGKVFLCGASRQPPSLWNHISNILFRALTGHIFIARSSYGSLAPSRDSSKWSKMPQWHPAFFLLTEKPLSFCGESSLSDTAAWAGLGGAEGVEAERHTSLECLKWTNNFWVDLRCSYQLHLLISRPSAFLSRTLNYCLYVSQTVLVLIDM